MSRPPDIGSLGAATYSTATTPSPTNKATRAPVNRPIEGKRGLVLSTHAATTVQPIAPRSGGEYTLKTRDAIRGTEQTAMPAAMFTANRPSIPTRTGPRPTASAPATGTT